MADGYHHFAILHFGIIAQFYFRYYNISGWLQKSQVVFFVGVPYPGQCTFKQAARDGDLGILSHYVFVGNNEYLLGGIQLPARDRLDDGLLSVYIPHAQGRFRLIWFSIRALFGKPKSGSDFDAFLTSEFWIETRHHALKVSLDGEVTVLHPPLHYRTRPQALRVIVPSEPAS